MWMKGVCAEPARIRSFSWRPKVEGLGPRASGGFEETPNTPVVDSIPTCPANQVLVLLPWGCGQTSPHIKYEMGAQSLVPISCLSHVYSSYGEQVYRDRLCTLFYVHAFV